jgi:tetratricopeptide (TPR) repeat protein
MADTQRITGKVGSQLKEIQELQNQYLIESQKRLKQANEDLEKAMSINSYNGFVWYNKGKYFFLIQKFEQASPFFDKFNLRTHGNRFKTFRSFQY